MMKNDMHVLVSGAGLAGLSTAYWMNRLGCRVTIVEMASGLRRGGTAVNVSGPAVDIAGRMGIFEQIRSNRLNLELWEFKNADDVTERTLSLKKEGEARSDDDLEIERNNLLDILFDTVKSDVEIIFDNSITGLGETHDDINVSFRNSSQRSFDLVFGCDGTHSVVRKLWFGPETEYSHFLEQYSAITIVDKLLIKQNTAQMYNAPGKFVMLNAYKNKTDIILGFASETEIPYDYRNEEQQRTIVEEQFVGQGWRTAELLDEVRRSTNFYFDKSCQIRMPSWTKGRVALVGDAAYCASPASGMGGSLALSGAAALADALREHNGNFELAFQNYDRTFRPFIEKIQAEALRTQSETLIPGTEEAIRQRNTQTRDAF